MSEGEIIFDESKARKFLENKDASELKSATSITDDAASILATSDSFPYGQLRLDSIEFLSPEAARALSGANANEVILSSLTSVSPEVAEALSSFRGSEILLDGVRELSAEAARNLARHRHRNGSCLRLDRLRENISPEVAYHLGTHVGTTYCDHGWALVSNDVAESLVRGIQDSDRQDGDKIVVRLVSDEVALTVSEVFSLLGLNEKNCKKIETALKSYAQSEATLKPKETAAIREVLCESDSPEEIGKALESLDELGANEADWLKVMFSKNALRSLMRINPDGLDVAWDGYPAERLPVWQALAKHLGKFPRSREWFKWEACRYFEHGDHAEDLAVGLTEELVPIVSFGLDKRDLWFTEPEISAKHAELLSRLSCEIKFKNLRDLTPDVVIALSEHRNNKTFEKLDVLSPEAAAEFHRHVCQHIGFPDLSTLPDASAEGLSKLGTYFLSLDSLTELSDSAAESLSEFKGDLILNGLTEVSVAAAKSLAEHRGDSLTLGGLTKLSDAAAESLAKHEGELFLNSVAEISDATAKSLARHEGNLYLDGLTKLSDKAAESLSEHKGRLSLAGLTELSDTAAKSLAEHEGRLTIDGSTTKLSKEAAKTLLEGRADVMSLNFGLESLARD